MKIRPEATPLRGRPTFLRRHGALLALSLAAALLPCRIDAAGPEGSRHGDGPTPKRATVRNVELGYEFEYPDDLRFRKFPSLEGGGFMPAALGEIDPRGNEVIFVEVRRDWRQARDFETFLADDVGGCDADGPFASQRCPRESVRLEKFRNGTEEEGYRIRRKRVVELFADNGATITEEADDLLVAYEIERRGGPAGAVVFHAGDRRWIGKMLEIAGTYRRLPRTR